MTAESSIPASGIASLAAWGTKPSGIFMTVCVREGAADAPLLSKAIAGERGGPLGGRAASSLRLAVVLP